jgi:hypothetical protein
LKLALTFGAAVTVPGHVALQQGFSRNRCYSWAISAVANLGNGAKLQQGGARIRLAQS